MRQSLRRSQPFLALALLRSATRPNAHFFGRRIRRPTSNAATQRATAGGLGKKARRLLGTAAGGTAGWGSLGAAVGTARMRQAAGGNSSPNSSMSKWRVRLCVPPRASRSASLPPARLAGGVFWAPSTECHVHHAHPSHVLAGEGGERGTRGRRLPALFLLSRFQCAHRLHIIVAAGGAECCDHCAAKPAVQTANVAAVVKSILRGLRYLNSNDDRVRVF